MKSSSIKHSQLKFGEKETTKLKIKKGVTFSDEKQKEDTSNIESSSISLSYNSRSSVFDGSVYKI